MAWTIPASGRIDLWSGPHHATAAGLSQSPPAWGVVSGLHL